MSGNSAEPGGKKTAAEGTRWAGLSLFSFFANLGLTILCKEILGFSAPGAFAAALGVVLIANFFALRYLVFDIRHVPIGGQARSFGLLTMGFRVGEWIVFSLIHFSSGVDYRVLVVLVLFVSSLIKFLTYRRVLSSPGRQARSLEG